MSSEHYIVSIALAYVRCSCGWKWRNHKLKDKTDEDLAQEAKATFDSHVAYHADL